jgi:hypothetical protein
MAEKFVDVAKKILAKNPNNPEIALINYRNTPRKELGSPNQRALSKNIRCSLPTTTQSLEPKVQTNVTDLLRKERETQKKFFDKGSIPKKLNCLKSIRKSSFKIPRQRNGLLELSLHWIPIRGL